MKKGKIVDYFRENIIQFKLSRKSMFEQLPSTTKDIDPSFFILFSDMPFPLQTTEILVIVQREI